MTTSTSSLDEELRKITELRKVVNTECHLVELELLRYKRQIRFSTGRIQLLYRKLRKIEKSKRTRLGMIIVEFDLRREELDWDMRHKEGRARSEAGSGQHEEGTEEGAEEFEETITEENEEKQ